VALATVERAHRRGRAALAAVGRRNRYGRAMSAVVELGETAP
jgi:hypothetical protein